MSLLIHTDKLYSSLTKSWLSWSVHLLFLHSLMRRNFTDMLFLCWKKYCFKIFIDSHRPSLFQSYKIMIELVYICCSYSPDLFSWYEFALLLKAIILKLSLIHTDKLYTTLRLWLSWSIFAVSVIWRNITDMLFHSCWKKKYYSNLFTNSNRRGWERDAAGTYLLFLLSLVCGNFTWKQRAALVDLLKIKFITSTHKGSSRVSSPIRFHLSALKGDQMR